MPAVSSSTIRGGIRPHFKKRIVHQRSSTEFAEYQSLRIKLVLFPFFLLMFYMITAMLVLRPHMTIGTLAWITLVVFFLSSESSSNLHASQKTENKFWIGMSSVYSALLLFAPDSPFKMNPDMQGLLASLCTLLVFTYLVHLWHKLSHRKSLERRRLPRSSMTTNHHHHQFDQQRANLLLTEINTSLSQLESNFVPGSLRRIFDRSLLMPINERRVVDAFSTCTGEELNFLVHQVNMNICLYRLKNHNHMGALVFQPDNTEVYARDLLCGNNRNALVELLAHTRLHELNVDARVAVIDAMQVVGMMRNPLTRERACNWVCHIMVNTKALDLVAMKQLMDSKGTIHSLHKLVYSDITDVAVRAKLLQHFQQESTYTQVRKVLSDVDDTFISSGGVYPAGMDATYPHHAVYPGASAFYSALGGGTNLAFLSARPHVYKDLAESRVYSKFERMLQTKQLHCMPTLLPGCLDSGQAYMLRGNFEPMAQKKLRNMVEYYGLYPECKMVFIGDNGQADVRAAELMVDRLGNQVIECVFIHQVQPLDKSFGYSQLERVKWGKFCFYRTMVGAAAFAYKRGMIHARALHHTMISAKQEFSMLISHQFPRGVIGVEERRQELAQDFALGNALLEGILGYVAPPPALCMFDIGSVVHTKLFGSGTVKEFRASDGMYLVSLCGGGMSGYFTLLDLAAMPIAQHGMGLHLGEQSTFTKGSLVQTQFGEGMVRNFREQDKVFEVVLTKWPAIAFLQESELSMVQLSRKDQFVKYGRALMQWRGFAPGKKPATIIVGTKVYVHALGEAVVLHWREHDSIAHLRFPSFESYTHISSISLRPATQQQQVAPPLHPPSPEAAGQRGRAISLEAMITGAKQKVVATLFSSPKSVVVVAKPPPFKIGDSVRVGQFGVGQVKQIRLGDGICEVHCLGGLKCFVQFSVCTKLPPASVSLYEKTRNALQQWVTFEDDPIRVRTAYGLGTLLTTRTPTDGICEVKLDWNAMAYLPAASVERLERRNRLLSLISPSSASSSPLTSPTNERRAVITPVQVTAATTAAAAADVVLHEGDLVSTPYGQAEIVNSPNEDRMVHVKFTKWHAVGVLHASVCSNLI